MCTQEWNFGSKCSSIFSFLRNLHTAFYRGCASLHSHQQYARDLFLHSHQLLLFVFFSMIATLINMRWYISWWFWFACPWWLAMLCFFFFFFFFYVSVGHLYFLFVKMTIQIFCPCLKSGCLFLMLSCMNCLYMLAINLFLVMSFADMFSHCYLLYFSLHWWLALLCKIF